MEQIKKEPAFVVGVVRHKIYSPVSKNNSIKESLLLTKATEKGLANKTVVKQSTKGSIKSLDCAVRKEPRKQQKQGQSIVRMITNLDLHQNCHICYLVLYPWRVCHFTV